MFYLKNRNKYNQIYSHFNFGTLRSFVCVFFKFDKLKSEIEFNNWDRSSLAVDGIDIADGTCEILDVSMLIFGDKDVVGVDVCNGSTEIECWTFSIKKQNFYQAENINKFFL